MPWTKSSGRKLKKLRETHGHTQMDLSRAISERLGKNVWVQQIQVWESGSNPSLPYAEALAAVYGVSIEHFLNDDDPLPEDAAR